MPIVYSTLTSNTKYTLWRKGGSDLKLRDASVLIKGGSNIADRHFMTPRGVATTITDEQYAKLKENTVFKRHAERGYIKVEEKPAPIEKVVSDMVARDPSAPLVPEDYDAENAAAPKTNKPKAPLPPKGHKGIQQPPKGEKSE